MILIASFRNSSTDSVTSIAGIGTWTIVPGSRSVSTADGRVSELWQCLNITSTGNALTITQTGTGTIAVVAIEIATTIGHFAFDSASATQEATASSSPAVGAPIKTNGSKDFVLSYVSSLAFQTFGPPSAPLIDSGNTDYHGNPYYYALNLPPQTFTPTTVVTGTPGAFHWSTGAWTTV
jgi:hypothetical protein